MEANWARSFISLTAVFFLGVIYMDIISAFVLTFTISYLIDMMMSLAGYERVSTGLDLWMFGRRDLNFYMTYVIKKAINYELIQ